MSLGRDPASIQNRVIENTDGDEDARAFNRLHTNAQNPSGIVPQLAHLLLRPILRTDFLWERRDLWSEET